MWWLLLLSLLLLLLLLPALPVLLSGTGGGNTMPGAVTTVCRGRPQTIPQRALEGGGQYPHAPAAVLHAAAANASCSCCCCCLFAAAAAAAAASVHGATAMLPHVTWVCRSAG
jgi:hypothetical protein